MSENFYRAFEERFRGSRELIKSRQRFYLPFILPFKEVVAAPAALDLGCGRGEWIEILSENGFDASGVDLDEGMLSACYQLGLNVRKCDALSALRALPDASLVLISGFHIAEHMPFEALQLLVQDALRVLKPGGVLILETPNPDNVSVATSSFYLDPTHQRPIPSQLLSFLVEYYGFVRVKVVGLNGAPEVERKQVTSLVDVLYAASSDYAVIGQKTADKKMMQILDAVYGEAIGINTLTLASLFDRRIERLELARSSVFKSLYVKGRRFLVRLWSKFQKGR